MTGSLPTVAVTSVPLFLKKFLLDFVETALGAILLLTIAFPTTINDVQRDFVVVGVATFGALVSAVRRNVPEFLKWLAGTLGVGSV